MKRPSLDAIADMIRVGDTEEAVAALIDLDRHIEMWMIDSWLVASETTKQWQFDPRYHAALITVARTMAYVVREGEYPLGRTERIARDSKMAELMKSLPAMLDAQQIEELLRGAGLFEEEQ